MRDWQFWDFSCPAPFSSSSISSPAITDKLAQQYGGNMKPEMIEEATRNAREVAEKSASDSQSSLGKIKRASLGQFSIRPRDKNNPHIKTVRVVSTIEYYLSD